MSMQDFNDDAQALIRLALGLEEDLHRRGDHLADDAAALRRLAARLAGVLRSSIEQEGANRAQLARARKRIGRLRAELGEYEEHVGGERWTLSAAARGGDF